MDDKLKAELEHHQKYSINRSSQQFLEKQRLFWDSVLRLAKSQNSGEISAPVLEIGNGPYGFFLSLGSRMDMYCVDPLNDEYKKIFPHLQKFSKTHFISSRIEDITGIPLCSTVLCYNVLDHVDDIEATVNNMCRLARDDAIFLIAVDYYPSKTIRYFMDKFKKQLDPPHPHHFDLEGIRHFLERSFEIKMVESDTKFQLVNEKPNPRSTIDTISTALKRPAIAMKVASFTILRKMGCGDETQPNMTKMAVFICTKKKQT